MVSLTKLCLVLWSVAAPSGAANPRNVLFIAVDDLRPQLSAYGHDFMKTPHIDQLAATGTLFQRAYVQYSFCGPSRNSFLTGRRPDRTKAWSFMNHFRENDVALCGSPGCQHSLPQYFKEHGYWTTGSGKLFHPGLPPNFDAPYSWDSFIMPANNCNGSTNGWPVLEPAVAIAGNVSCPAVQSGCSNRTGAITAIDRLADTARWCHYDPAKLERPTEDDLVVQSAIQHLREARQRLHGPGKQPFFIGVGFHKPHLPFYSPQECVNRYPDGPMAAPAHQLPPAGMPLCAWHEGGFNNRWGQPCANNKSGAECDKQLGTFRKQYYAAVSYTDDNVGKVLAELEAQGLANDTIVSFVGDHGWQLGEWNEWRKMTNFELGVRVPLIIRDPAKPASHGVKTPALVEAVDLFQTLAGLAGLPSPPADQGLQGSDLSAMFDQVPTSGAGPKDAAYSQFAKKNSWSAELKERVLWNECTKCNHTDIDVMGYSVRVDRWRYTEWAVWNKSLLEPVWSNLSGVELYDHEGDMGADFDYDIANLASLPEHKGLVANLSARLHAFFEKGQDSPGVF